MRSESIKLLIGSVANYLSPEQASARAAARDDLIKVIESFEGNSDFSEMSFLFDEPFRLEDRLVFFLALSAFLDRRVVSLFSRYGRVDEYFRFSVHALIHACSDDLSEQLALMQRLSIFSPLRARKIIELYPPKLAGNDDDIQAMIVHVPHRIISTFAGMPDLSPLLADFITIDMTGKPFYQVVLHDHIKQSIARLFQIKSNSDTVLHTPYTVAFIHGDRNYRLDIARGITNFLKIPLLIFDCGLLNGSAAESFRLLRTACDDAIFFRMALALDNVSQFIRDEDNSHILANLLEKHRNQYIFLMFDGESFIDKRFMDTIEAVFEIPHFSAKMREALWESSLPAELSISPDINLASLSEEFDLNFSNIMNASMVAQTIARTNQSDILTHDQLDFGARLQSRTSVSNFSRFKTPSKGLSDIIVADETREQIKCLINACRERSAVMGEWGFGRKLTTGKCVSALLTGEPGTGKTFCAEVIAGTLGYPLIHVDVAAIVSKYVGETEKNIKSIFSQARSKKAVLLFDEADALFAARVEVKSSMDRFANMEVNALLQEVDDFEGILILTSNLPENIDEAFKRRMLFQIEFPMPSVDLRERLWRTLLPPETPRSDEIDFAKLAKNFELSGGYIKNAILIAAYEARQDGKLEMKHLVKSAIDQCKICGKLFKDI